MEWHSLIIDFPNLCDSGDVGGAFRATEDIVIHEV
jgi:hypothetical protein